MRKQCDIIVTKTDTSDLKSPTDVLHHIVRNKEIINSGQTEKRCSIDSEVSEANTLISSSSETDGTDNGRRRKRINHHSIRGTMSDSEMEMSGVSRYLYHTIMRGCCGHDRMIVGFTPCYQNLSPLTLLVRIPLRQLQYNIM